MREDRQRQVFRWISETFGLENVTLEQRAIRFLEEAIELYQACGADPAMAHKLIDFVFARPVGTIHGELGGVGITLLGVAEASGRSADKCEVMEFDRVRSFSQDHFRARNKAKNNAGFHDTKK